MERGDRDALGVPLTGRVTRSHSDASAASIQPMLRDAPKGFEEAIVRGISGESRWFLQGIRHHILAMYKKMKEAEGAKLSIEQQYDLLQDAARDIITLILLWQAYFCYFHLKNPALPPDPNMVFEALTQGMEQHPLVASNKIEMKELFETVCQKFPGLFNASKYATLSGYGPLEDGEDKPTVAQRIAITVLQKGFNGLFGNSRRLLLIANHHFSLESKVLFTINPKVFPDILATVIEFMWVRTKNPFLVFYATIFNDTNFCSDADEVFGHLEEDQTSGAADDNASVRKMRLLRLSMRELLSEESATSRHQKHPVVQKTMQTVEDIWRRIYRGELVMPVDFTPPHRKCLDDRSCLGIGVNWLLLPLIALIGVVLLSPKQDVLFGTSPSLTEWLIELLKAMGVVKVTNGLLKGGDWLVARVWYLYRVKGGCSREPMGSSATAVLAHKRLLSADIPLTVGVDDDLHGVAKDRECQGSGAALPDERDSGAKGEYGTFGRAAAAQALNQGGDTVIEVDEGAPEVK